MKRFHSISPAHLTWIALGIFGAGCAGSEDELESRTGALTSAQQDILGFEQPGLWSSLAGPVTTLSTDHTQGDKSLEVKAHGYYVLFSNPLTSVGPVGRPISFDLKLPAKQPNKYWFGAAQLYVSIPSQGVYNSYVGQVELTGLPLDKWNTLSFNFSASLASKLGATSYKDLRFGIVLNVPKNASGSYLVDNLKPSIGSGGTGGCGTGGKGTGGVGGGGGRGTGGASTGGAGTGGKGTGGASTGGASTGGKGTGGASTGGASTGGASTGGKGTGGASTGGASTGGASTGGASTGGASTGGRATGGASTGGRGTGGASTGGASTGGASTGGASTGGASTGGASTGGRGTGGASTGGRGTGGASTGGAGTGGAGGSCVPTACAGTICDSCTTDNCVPSTDGCDAITDPTDKALCEAAYGCFVTPVNACVTQGDPLKCWCGSNPTTCVTSNADPTKANGPCLSAIIAAARLTPATYDAATIKQRFVDPSFPLGRAVNLTSCRGSFCNAECSVP